MLFLLLLLLVLLLLLILLLILLLLLLLLLLLPNACNIDNIYTHVTYNSNTYRLLHRKSAVRIFIHELQNFGKRTSERS